MTRRRTCSQLWTAQQAQDADRHTMGVLGISSAVLMERAALCVSAVVEELLDEASAEVHVLCGPGNNGGDGLAVARLLHGRGRAVVAHQVVPAGHPAGAEQLAWARSAGVAVRDGLGERPKGPLLVVDALLGTGSRGAPRGAIGDALRWIHSDDRVVAVDAPTGIDVDSGAAAASTPHACRTVTFQRSKPGLHVTPGRAFAGAIVVAEIGLLGPPGALLGPRTILIDPERIATVLEALPLPRHKGIAGHVAVIGGAAGTPGAAILAGEAALRSGAGLVTLCSGDAAVRAQIIAARPELMAAAGEVGSIPASANSLVVGPGLVGEEPAGMLGSAQEDPRAAVWDAGALHALHARSRGGPKILTPHPGEAARLMARIRPDEEWTAGAVQAERLAVARALAAHFAAVVVLKGEGSIVADPRGEVAIDLLGTAALATAGTGDVLAGAIGALLARGLEPFEAAQAGVCLHSGAGRLAAARGRALAGEVAAALASVDLREFTEAWPVCIAG